MDGFMHIYNRDLDHVTCIKRNDEKLLVKDNDVKQRLMMLKKDVTNL